MLLMALFLLSLTACYGIKISFTRTTSGQFSEILQNKFGMASGSRVSVDYNLIYSNPETTSYFVMLLISPPISPYLPLCFTLYNVDPTYECTPLPAPRW